MSAVAITTAHDCAIADVTNRPNSGAFIHDRIAWPHSADSAHEAIVAALVACAATDARGVHRGKDEPEQRVMRRERERDGGLRRRERREGATARCGDHDRGQRARRAEDHGRFGAERAGRQRDGCERRNPRVREYREEPRVHVPRGHARRPAVRRRQPLHQERLRRLEVMQEDERDEQPELAPGRGMRQRGEGGSPASSHRTSTLAVVVVVTRASGARGVVLLVCRRRGSHASSPPARPAPRAVRGEEGSAT